MPVPRDEVVGFPRVWEPFHDVTVAAEAVHRINVLQNIFSVLGVSVHAVVSSAEVRQAVRVLWKGYKEFLRGYDASALLVWEDYLRWVEQQTGQVFADRTPPWVRLREIIEILAWKKGDAQCSM